MSGPLDLDAIEARANAATPGPWGVEKDQEGFFEVVGLNNDLTPGASFGATYSGITNYPTPEDAAFVAAARTDVPDLVATVRRLMAVKGSANVFRFLWEGAEEELSVIREELEKLLQLDDVDEIHGAILEILTPEGEELTPDEQSRGAEFIAEMRAKFDAEKAARESDPEAAS